ncbi:hypothetical protein [Kineococcus sp. SYSU DK003]|uniref:hypothetical protein n=1 Tax=Kineococcus sp. SYSU DK003 TaxID=3383124 RepID=UPI003D7DAC22
MPTQDRGGPGDRDDREDRDRAWRRTALLLERRAALIRRRARGVQPRRMPLSARLRTRRVTEEPDTQV